MFALNAGGFGLTVGLIAGAASAASRPGELSAAHRGVVLRVTDDTAAVRRALIEAHPIRIDEVTSLSGDPVDTVMTEEQDSDTSTPDDMVANATSDDYSPADASKARQEEPSSSVVPS